MIFAHMRSFVFFISGCCALSSLATTTTDSTVAATTTGDSYSSLLGSESSVSSFSAPGEASSLETQAVSVSTDDSQLAQATSSPQTTPITSSTVSSTTILNDQGNPNVVTVPAVVTYALITLETQEVLTLPVTYESVIVETVNSIAYYK